MKKRVLAGLLITTLLIVPFTARGAIIPVFDSAAFTQMLVESFWWLEDIALQGEQIVNQVLQIEQGILQLESWALALKRLDFSALPIVGGPLASITRVFHKAESAFWNAALITEKFDELYSPFHVELMPSSAYFSKAFDWNDATREAGWVAMQQQAHLPLSLESVEVALRQALGRSEAAEGHLQAAQAGNQLLGTQIAQHNETNALLGTMAHSQSVRDMNEAAAQDQAMLRLERAMEGWTAWTKTEGLAALPTALR